MTDTNIKTVNVIVNWDKIKTINGITSYVLFHKSVKGMVMSKWGSEVDADRLLVGRSDQC